jgi:threonyl-tRNA synthetase
VRAVTDLRGERIARKIVDARERAIPLLLAVGAREQAAGTVSVRYRDGRQEVLPLTEAVAQVAAAARVPLGA